MWQLTISRHVPASMSRLLIKRAKTKSKSQNSSGSQQETTVYWDKRMLRLLDRWGEGTVWEEIRWLLGGSHGRVIDIACGTGRTIELLADLKQIELHGFDLSDLLIRRAIERGISRNRLNVCDATQTPYANESFNYGYSIGSLEHFTEEGICLCLLDNKRIVKRTVFHMIPTSKTKQNEGWITTYQSFFLNSIDWWLDKCRQIYPHTTVIESSFQDSMSIGYWLVCNKEK